MTITDRNDKLKHFITCLKCELSGKCCDDNCPTQYAAGTMGEIVENLEAISKALEQEPCEDCVSRKEVLNLVRFNAFHVKSQIKAIENMPPVTPQEPKIGHWIYRTSDDYLGELNRYYECSECGRTVGDAIGDIYDTYPYCHCGAKMVKPQESEDKE